MRAYKRFVTTLALLMLMCPLSQAQQSLRFLMLENRTMPFGLIERAADGQLLLVGGIVKDWQDALARELGRKPLNVLLPRMRQDLAVADKLVDLRCFISRDWLTEAQIRQYDWPAPFFDVEERLVGAVGGKTADRFEDLTGARIGTVLGYTYRSLEPLFAADRAKRDDAPNETLLISKQMAKRTDFSVMRALDFQYLRKNDPQFASLVLLPLVVSRFPLYCARPKYSNVSLQELSKAQERLLKAGTLERILAKYR